MQMQMLPSLSLSPTSSKQPLSFSSAQHPFLSINNNNNGGDNNYNNNNNIATSFRMA